MNHEAVLHLLAVIVLVCVVVVIAIDIAADYHVTVGLRLKWSLLWTGCRYLGSVCAVVLALDILF